MLLCTTNPSLLIHPSEATIPVSHEPVELSGVCRPAVTLLDPDAQLSSPASIQISPPDTTLFQSKEPLFDLPPLHAIILPQSVQRHFQPLEAGSAILPYLLALSFQPVEPALQLVQSLEAA